MLLSYLNTPLCFAYKLLSVQRGFFTNVCKCSQTYPTLGVRRPFLAHSRGLTGLVRGRTYG